MKSKWLVICFTIFFSVAIFAENRDDHTKKPTVIIIGAGVAGLSAAQTLIKQHIPVLVLEARNRIGGRINTQYQNGIGLDLGAGWIHGINNNPIMDIVNREHITTLPVAYNDNALSYKLKSWIIYDNDHAVSPEVLKRLTLLVESFETFVFNTTSKHQRDSIDDALKVFITTHVIHDDLSRLFNYVIRNVYIYEYGANLPEISWQSDMPYASSSIGGINALLPRGYSQILAPLSKDVPIKLNQVVREIKYRVSGVVVKTQDQQYQTNHVIITVPLGVLQSGAIHFNPSLPPEKQYALKQIKMGSYNKIFLRYEKPFWDKDKEWIGQVADDLKTSWDILNLYPFTHQPILVLFTGGRLAREVEKLSDNETILAATQTLKKIYGDHIPSPTTHVITRWQSDPYSLGSYSYLSKKGDLSAYQSLANPLMNRLFFAGEATSISDPATVHGAYVSGIRAANEVIREIKANH